MTQELIIDGLYHCPGCRRPFSTGFDEYEEGLCESCFTSLKLHREGMEAERKRNQALCTLIEQAKIALELIPPTDDRIRDRILELSNAITEAERVL